ncbi:MAG: mycothione reductase [Acidimicrobiales bacterium]|nr:mycothione reductase [Acidimicrobiales bacterium]
MQRFDLIIIGAGSGNSIIGPEHDDMDIAIVERGLFGGTCLNVGCIPSKMFVYAAEIAELARRGPDLGVNTRFDGADWPAIRDRVFDRIDPMAEGGADYRRGLDNVTVFAHDARFVGPKELQVGDDTITADTIVLAAGARAFVPPIPGIDTAGAHTSDTIMRVDTLPERLIVMGGGYIAAELGSVFGSLGSDVTYLMRSDTMLRAQDHDISSRITRIYGDRFTTHTDVFIEQVRRDGDELVVDLRGVGEVRGDELLVASGRIPNGDQLGVAETGVAMDDAGYVITDEFGRTNVDGIWALGDIGNPVQLKHVANHEARVVAHNLTNPGALQAMNHDLIPTAVFSHPQIGSVGLTETQCQEQGLDYTAHVQKYGSAAYGWAMEDTESICKLIMDNGARKLLGAHIMGPQAPTLIQQLIQGMNFGQTVDEMATGQYYIHPALPEVIEQALLEL